MKLRLQLGLALSVCIPVLWVVAASAAPDDKDKPTCYKLIGIDTPLEHANEPGNNFAKEWAAKNNVSGSLDTTLVVTSKDRPSHTWTVNAKSGTATVIDTGANPQGHVDLTWTVPPDVWCSNQDVTIAVTSAGSGQIWAGPHLEQFPADRCDR